MNTGFLGVPWLVWSLLALVVAGVFVVVVPGAERVYATSGLRFVILRWFHSLCWVLLALSFALRGFDHPTLSGLVNPFAIGGGVAYALYLATYVMTPAA